METWQETAARQKADAARAHRLFPLVLLVVLCGILIVGLILPLGDFLRAEVRTVLSGP